MATITAGVAAPIFWGESLSPAFTGLKAAKEVYELMDSRRQQNKKEYVDYAKEMMKPISDVNSVKESVRKLTNFIEAARREIEIIKVGEEVYTNLPG